uniref:Methionine adenosyltransferase 2 subunit beta n=1 Tax=Graphocephala atropunctata TaxID=36148 RepID=A0A1B6KPV6_9HEMI
MMTSKQKNKLFLTGASGLLGRAIYKKFESEGWNVYGTAFIRVQNGLHELDITKKEDVEKAITDFHPDFVIHAAAQRFPDKVDSDPEAARCLNVDATSFVVDAAAKVGAPLLYISTDYVFDGKGGTAYTVQDKPSPINLYGQTKLEGEVITLKHAENSVLRIPVLYGPVLDLKESAVTCLLEPLLTTAKVAYVSHLERRCPSHVNDIALICLQLANARNDETVRGIFQWCGEEKMTKYQMVLKMAEVFKIPHSHVKPEMKLGASATRPLDTELDRSRLNQLGFGQHTPFNEGLLDVLCSWVSLNVNLLPDVRPYTAPPVKS